MLKALRIPPIYTFAALVAAMVLNQAPVLVYPSRTAGGLAAILGIALAVWAVVTIRAHRTPLHPGHTPVALVTSGPFRLNRNPIYTGMVLLVLGAGLAKGSLLGLIPAFVLWWFLDRDFAAPEEALLVEEFGDEGADFVARVRRW